MSIPASYSGLCIECCEGWQPGDLIRSVVVGPEHFEVQIADDDDAQ